MSFDPKVRASVPPRIPTNPGTRAVVAPPAVKVEDTVAVPPKGFAASDGFDVVTNRSANKESVGRAVRNGNQDDSIGRTVRNGNQDDSIGRPKNGSSDDSIGRPKNGSSDDSIGRPKTGSSDDSIGRPKTGEGSPDDSIGRPKKTGNSDDSIGDGGAPVATAASFDAVRDSLVGPETDPNRIALRESVFKSLENPSYAANVPAGDPRVVPLLKQNLTAFGNTLGTASRSQFATLTSKLDEGGLRLLGALVEQDPKLLDESDSRGGTLLSNLSRMATQPVNSKLASDLNQSELLTSTLRDVVNPNRVDQGNAPTCTVASIQFELVADSPAEYARVMADLSGPSGTSVMRGGGSMKVDAGDAAAAALDDRSPTDALFQTAAMEYANGRFADFNPVSGKSTDSRTGAVTQGVHPIQQTALLEQLFGVNYSTKNMYSEAQGQKMLDSLRGFDATKNQNRPVILHLDQGSINHAVTLEKIADGRVLYRDPYGVLRSMPEDLFPKYVVTVQQPIQ